jgi:hypothetical protein
VSLSGFLAPRRLSGPTTASSGDTGPSWSPSARPSVTLPWPSMPRVRSAIGGGTKTAAVPRPNSRGRGHRAASSPLTDGGTARRGTAAYRHHTSQPKRVQAVTIETQCYPCSSIQEARPCSSGAYCSGAEQQRLPASLAAWELVICVRFGHGLRGRSALAHPG